MSSGDSFSGAGASGGWPAEPARSWRVNPALAVAKVAGAAALAALGLLLGRADPVQWGLALLGCAVLLGWAARDVLAPVRLAADTAGVTVVTGFAGRRRVPWAAVERVRVDRRQRLGLTSALLEIDTGDTVHLFGAQDLGAEPDEVAAALAALRTGGSA